LYFGTAIFNDHFFRRLILNSGWSRAQVRGVSTSCMASSKLSALVHRSISWQHWVSYSFSIRLVSQLLHLHLNILIKLNKKQIPFTQICINVQTIKRPCDMPLNIFYYMALSPSIDL
jgi:hypothetical protein